MTRKLRWQRSDGEGSQERGARKRSENQLEELCTENFSVGEKRLLMELDIVNKNEEPDQVRAQRTEH